MALIVQKFGGSSVANAERVMNVANIVANTYNDGNDVIVVVSAQGDTTDDLIAKAEEINPKHSRREMDQLLAAGEQISISLLAMVLKNSISLLFLFLAGRQVSRQAQLIQQLVSSILIQTALSPNSTKTRL